ncbi:hypothetical protein EJA10_03825 [Mesobacillus subterraneus]|uniref:Uncharacterized protein n=1 Tax=Mesobacillus subterraneus TaxID=285983 RepID=A0A3R9ECE0_9BACI|nr:hypothetical protein EJA10_03825 [Mesobacillus subterraneus]
MEYLYFFGLPVLGGVWFYNLIVLLRNLHNRRDIHNQIVLGTAFSVTFVFLFMLAFLSVH